jgi:hypothetical protein
MSQTTETRQERKSALDQFASLSAAPSDNLPVAMPAARAPAALSFASQPVQTPRDMRKVFEEIRVLAAAAGEDWYYRYPVQNRKKGTTEWIEGPSIKQANAMALTYRNCHVDCLVEDLGTHWMLHGVFIDRENGVSFVRPFQQRKMASRLGGSDDARREDASFAIGVSKAERNAIVNALETLSDYAFREAKEALVDKIGSNIAKWRDRAIERTSAHLDLKRVEAVIGRPAKEWLAPDIAKVIAMMKAVGDGMASLDETFPPLAGAEKPSAMDQFASGVSEPGADGAGELSPEQPDPGAGTEAGEDGNPSKSSPALYKEAIDKILGAANDPNLPDPEERIANLDGPVRDIWNAALPDDHAFVTFALKCAVNIVNEKLTLASARKMLEAKIP